MEKLCRSYRFWSRSSSSIHVPNLILVLGLPTSLEEGHPPFAGPTREANWVACSSESPIEVWEYQIRLDLLGCPTALHY